MPINQIVVKTIHNSNRRRQLAGGLLASSSLLEEEESLFDPILYNRQHSEIGTLHFTQPRGGSDQHIRHQLEILVSALVKAIDWKSNLF